MATQIVIGNGSFIKIDDSFHINWADKGNAMPALPDTIHFVIWNDLVGQNEIQSKDASTGNMTGNTGSTTVAALLTWGETRKGQIEAAQAAYDTAVADDEANGTSNAAGKTWIDYDSNYS